MLKQRVITGVILIPIMVAMLLYLPTRWLAILFGAIALAGAWEWACWLVKILLQKFVMCLCAHY